MKSAWLSINSTVTISSFCLCMWHVDTGIYSRVTYWDVRAWWSQAQKRREWFWWAKLSCSGQRTRRAKRGLSAQRLFSFTKALTIPRSRSSFKPLSCPQLSEPRSPWLRLSLLTSLPRGSKTPSTLWKKWRRYSWLWTGCVLYLENLLFSSN